MTKTNNRKRKRAKVRPSYCRSTCPRGRYPNDAPISDARDFPFFAKNRVATEMG